MIVDEDKFEKILKMSQIELKEYLYNMLKNISYNDIIFNDGFIFAEGNIPVLLVAHMDRHPRLSECVCIINKRLDQNGNTIWSSPEGIAGDDRCGVYIILELIKKYRPYVLFCEDEEIGCVGSNKFIKSKYLDKIKNLNYLIQIDRGHGHRNIEGKHNKHGRDVVFYDVTNNEFIKKVVELTGYGIGKGSCTDIKYLSAATNIASFNISCGYCNEHTLDEYINFTEMINCYNAIEKVINGINDKYLTNMEDI